MNKGININGTEVRFFKYAESDTLCIVVDDAWHPFTHSVNKGREVALAEDVVSLWFGSCSGEAIRLAFPDIEEFTPATPVVEGEADE